MTSRLVFFVVAAAAITPAVATAQTADQLLADHALLRSELDRCKQLGMASNDDPRCRAARTAEQRRFFGNGVGYTNKPVNAFPSTPAYVAPGQDRAPAGSPPQSGPPHG